MTTPRQIEYFSTFVSRHGFVNNFFIFAVGSPTTQNCWSI